MVLNEKIESHNHFTKTTAESQCNWFWVKESHLDKELGNSSLQEFDLKIPLSNISVKVHKAIIFLGKLGSPGVWMMWLPTFHNMSRH